MSIISKMDGATHKWLTFFQVMFSLKMVRDNCLCSLKVILQNSALLPLLLWKKVLGEDWRQTQATLCHHLQVLHVFSLQVLLKPLSKIWLRLQAKSWLDDINTMYLTFTGWENLPENMKSEGFSSLSPRVCLPFTAEVHCLPAAKWPHWSRDLNHLEHLELLNSDLLPLLVYHLDPSRLAQCIKIRLHLQMT